MVFAQIARVRIRQVAVAGEHILKRDAVGKRAVALREGQLDVELVGLRAARKRILQDAKAVHARGRIKQHELRRARQTIKRRIGDHRIGFNQELWVEGVAGLFAVGGVKHEQLAVLLTEGHHAGAHRASCAVLHCAGEELLHVRRQEPLLVGAKLALVDSEIEVVTDSDLVDNPRSLQSPLAQRFGLSVGRTRNRDEGRVGVDVDVCRLFGRRAGSVNAARSNSGRHQVAASSRRRANRKGLRRVLVPHCGPL